MGIALPSLDRPLRISADPALSLDEFWRFSEDSPNLRMERCASGEIVVTSPTQRRSGFRNLQITRALGNWAESDGRGYGFDSSTGFTLPDGSVMSPDASWIEGSKWTPDAEDSYAATLAPDFVIELRSSSDNLFALREKMRLWMQMAFSWRGWLIRRAKLLSSTVRAARLKCRKAALQPTAKVR